MRSNCFSVPVVLVWPPRIEPDRIPSDDSQLALDFGEIGLDKSDPEIRLPYMDNEYVIGQYDFDGDKVDELIIAVKSDHEGMDCGVCLNIWRIDDMKQWILSAPGILGDPTCELVLNKIKVPRNLRGFYYEWTFQNGTFEDTGNS